VADLERAVERGQRVASDSVKRMGVDEKAIAKGHKYLTLIYDLEAGSVIHIADDRKKESLDGYLTSLWLEERNGIEAIAMDMWEPYLQSVLEHVPGAADKIVNDRFHIMKHMVDAVNDVRKREHRALMKEGDETLKGSKRDVYSRRPPEQRRGCGASVWTATGRAWSSRRMRRLWGYPSGLGRHWKGWYWATHSRLAPVIEWRA
jgi:transposase